MALDDLEKKWLHKEVENFVVRSSDNKKGDVLITKQELFNVLSRIYQQGKQVMI